MPPMTLLVGTPSTETVNAWIVIREKRGGKASSGARIFSKPFAARYCTLVLRSRGNNLTLSACAFTSCLNLLR